MLYNFVQHFKTIEKCFKPAVYKGLKHFSDLPQTGIEPVREDKSRRILSPVRLPVPPLRHISHRHVNGAYRARTYDPLLVRQMLSQLS